MFHIRVGDETFSIANNIIPPRSYLAAVVTDTITISKDNDDIPLIAPIIEFLQGGEFPPEECQQWMDFLGVDPRTNYEMVVQQEQFMRDHMYKQGFEQHAINTKPYHNLIKLTPELWEQLTVTSGAGSLFTQGVLNKQSWEQIQAALAKHKHVFGIKNCMIAGGHIFAALFGTTSSDIDIFFYDTNTTEAEENIYKLVDLLGWGDPQLLEKYENILTNVMNYMTTAEDDNRGFNYLFRDNIENAEYVKNFTEAAASVGLVPGVPNLLTHYDYPLWREYHQYFVAKHMAGMVNEVNTNPFFNCTFTRSVNAVTIGWYQIIQRLYRTPSEILHGFDVDCCCLGYDGTNIWLTPRALHSFSKGYNRINFNVMSPSYEPRLAKYADRGMGVYVPNFDANKVQDGYCSIKFVSGLSLLIKLDAINKDNRSYFRECYQNLCAGLSDYDTNHLTSQSLLKVVDNHISLARRDRVYQQHLPLMLRVQEQLKNGDIIYGGTGTIKPVIDQLGFTCDFNGLLILMKNKAKLTDKIKQLLHYDNADMIVFLTKILKCDVPINITWKTTNPGEQMTGTFHKLVLTDHSKWYNGPLYQQ